MGIGDQYLGFGAILCFLPIGAIELEYTLIRSVRRTISLQIMPDATLVVRAPLRMPQADIDRLIRDKENWIVKHRNIKKRQQAAKASFALQIGDFLTLMGREYPLCACEGVRTGFDGSCFFVLSGRSADERKAAVIQIYKHLARSVLTGKAEAYAKRMGVRFRSVKVSSARTRWGSCSGQGNLTFSWRLMLAGEAEIDYVVVHELAHLRQPNHSSRFWTVVQSVLPDYIARRKRLAAVQDKLNRENWD